jgi:hypothetical protein
MRTQWRLCLVVGHRREHVTRQAFHHVAQQALVAAFGGKHRRLDQQRLQFRAAVGHTLLGSRPVGRLHRHQQDEEIPTSFASSTCRRYSAHVSTGASLAGSLNMQTGGLGFGSRYVFQSCEATLQGAHCSTCSGSRSRRHGRRSVRASASTFARSMKASSSSSARRSTTLSPKMARTTSSPCR